MPCHVFVLMPRGGGGPGTGERAQWEQKYMKLNEDYTTLLKTHADVCSALVFLLDWHLFNSIFLSLNVYF